MITIVEEKTYKIPQIKLTYLSDVKPSEKPKIKQSKDTADIFRRSYDEGEIGFQEFFKVLYLDCSGKVMGIHTLSMGGVESTIVDLKVLFTGALLAKASVIILCHNHPSGNLKPSSYDNDLTKRVAEAGKMLDIKLTDHIIITADDYYSYADEGKL